MNDFTPDQIALIKRTIMPKGSTDDELKLFLITAKKTQLDPFTRQIYATKIKEKLSIQATIDGLRLVAERSKKYRGQTPAYWCGPDGKWTDIWLKKEYPAAAKVGVYKEGFAEPLYGFAKWDEYVQKNFKGEAAFMWHKMPALMIAKVAEALALRKAFPNDLSGIYSEEEMQQAQPLDTTEKPALPPSQSQSLAAPQHSEGNVEEEPEAERPIDDFNLADFVVTVGKYSGKKLGDIDEGELSGYVDYFAKKSLQGDMLENWKMMKEYVNRDNIPY